MSDVMTPERLEEIKARGSKATLGPWKVFEIQHPYKFTPSRPEFKGEGNHVERMIMTEWVHPQLNGNCPVVVTATGIGTPENGPVHFSSIDEEDADFIAHARRDVPELLAEVVQLNARVAELEAKLVEWRERSTKLFWGAKEFIDDWKKGDFSLSTLAALDAQSLDDALTTFSSSLRETAADPAPADTDTPGSWEEMDGHG